MAAYVEIVIPGSIDIRDQQSLLLYFQKQLSDIGSRFSEALDLVCDQKTTHAILENVTINQVRVVDELIQIEYHVALSEFRACQDSMIEYRYTRTVVGARFGSAWRFDKFVPDPERSTCDEL